jgi:hypothetical protein
MSDPRGAVQDVRGPAGPAPLRRDRSIRRTATLDMTWPAGWTGQLRLDGNARDAVTLAAGSAPRIVAQASASVGVGAEREIQDIRATPGRAGIERLVGCRGGGHLRAALDEFLPGERKAGTPLYLLLDDISGASLIAGFAWLRWVERGLERPLARRRERPNMEGICIGFRPGSSALHEIGQGPSHRAQPVGPLVHPDDPEGWHPLAELPQISMRRARRIDVWVDGAIQIDAAFQDSAGDPEHGRIAVHEYRIAATADPRTGELLSLAPDARILPFMECPSAAARALDLLGAPLAELRKVVLERLAKTNGCTHLNDALRALAEVPVLLSQLRASEAGGSSRAAP